MPNPSIEEVRALAQERSQKYGVPFDLTWKVMRRESGFNANAVSGAGAYGFMQLMPATAKDLGVDIKDWRQNIDGGIRYLGQQLKDFGGDQRLALAAYNSGPGSARKRGRNWGAYPQETRDYIQAILGSDLEAGMPNPNSPNPGIQVGDLSAPTPITDDQLSLDKAVRGPKPTLFEQVLLSAEQDWASAWIFKNADSPAAPDPDFVMTDEFAKTLTEGLPHDRFNYFNDVHSEAHGLWKRDQLVESLDREEKLAEAGLGGVGVRLVTSLFDPVTIPMAIATGGVGALAKGGLATRAAAGALTGAATGAAYGAASAGLNPLGNDSDVWKMAGFGLALGGVFGSLAKNGNAAEAATMERAGRKLVGDPAADVTVGTGSSVGAARNLRSAGLTEDTEEIADIAGSINVSTSMAGARKSTAAQLKSSPNPFVRAVGNFLVEDAVGNTKVGKVVFGASEEQTLIEREYATRTSQAIFPNFSAYAKARGWNMFERNFNTQRWDEFTSAVHRAVTSDVADDALEASVRDARNKVRKWMNDYREELHNPGKRDGQELPSIRGFDDLDANPFYLPRITSLRKVADLIDRFNGSVEPMVKLVSGSMRAQAYKFGNPLPKELADKFAKGYVRKLHSLRAGEEMSAFRALSGEDSSQLRDLMGDALRDAGVHVTDDELMSMTKWLDVKDEVTKKGAPARGKRRVLLDEHYVDPETGLKISDLFHTDVHHLMEAYNRQMSGRLALGRLKIENPLFKTGQSDKPYLIEGIQTDGQVDTLIQNALRVGRHLNVKDEQISKDAENLRWVFDRILGRPDPTDSWRYAPALQLMRDYNFARVMGASGFAQIPEIMNIPAQVGLKAFLGSMSAARGWLKDIKTGKLNDEVLAELEGALGFGNDIYRWSPKITSVEENGSLFQVGAGSKGFQTAQLAAEHSKRFVALAGGMAPITAFSQRLAMGAIWAKFSQAAFGKNAIGALRARSLGIADDEMSAILDQIRLHSTEAPSPLGGSRTMRQPNMHLWDPKVRHQFTMAMFRWNRKMVQENDIGQLHRFMSSQGARILLQFRTFMIGAYEKQFLGNFPAQVGAWDSFASYSAQLFGAFLTYTARQHVMSIGRSDREQFLEERLSPARLATGTFQGTGFSSLMPAAFDSLYAPFAGEGLFDARTTGQPTDLWFGNPTTGWFDDATKAVGSAADFATGEGNQSDARAMARILPFSNVVPFTLMFNAMISPLDEPKR